MEKIKWNEFCQDRNLKKSQEAMESRGLCICCASVLRAATKLLKLLLNSAQGQAINILEQLQSGLMCISLPFLQFSPPLFAYCSFTGPADLARILHQHAIITFGGFCLCKPCLSLFTPEQGLYCYLSLCLSDCNPFTQISASGSLLVNNSNITSSLVNNINIKTKQKKKTKIIYI